MISSRTSASLITTSPCFRHAARRMANSSSSVGSERGRCRSSDPRTSLCTAHLPQAGGVVADDLERVSVHPRRRHPLLPLEAVAFVAADDQVIEAHLDTVLRPEDDEILALRCIERVDDCGLIAEQPVGVLGAQIEEARETALIDRQPERLAVGGPIVLALLDQRVPDAHRRLEQAVLYKVSEIAAGQA